MKTAKPKLKKPPATGGLGSFDGVIDMGDDAIMPHGRMSKAPSKRLETYMEDALDALTAPNRRDALKILK